jgi:hypothetical protein
VTEIRSEHACAGSKIWWADLPEVYPTLGSAGCAELTSPVYGNATESLGEDDLERYLILKTGRVRDIMDLSS